MLSRRAVGTAVFAGMIAASSIGVFLIPMLYAVFQGAREAGEGEIPPTKNNLASLADQTQRVPRDDELLVSQDHIGRQRRVGSRQQWPSRLVRRLVDRKPNQCRRCSTRARISGLRSPMPAVNTIPSMPPMAAANAPAVRAT